jgi:DNA repair exonuclease SbcCD ATPase subunit
MQSRLDETEQNVLKGGRKARAKMDSRIRELESELDAENRRLGDAQKNLRKSERRIKELTYQQDEDRKNHERMQALIDQLQGKIRCVYLRTLSLGQVAACLGLSYKWNVCRNLSIVITSHSI